MERVWSLGRDGDLLGQGQWWRGEEQLVQGACWERLAETCWCAGSGVSGTEAHPGDSKAFDQSTWENDLLLIGQQRCRVLGWCREMLLSILGKLPGN